MMSTERMYYYVGIVKKGIVGQPACGMVMSDAQFNDKAEQFDDFGMELLQKGLTGTRL